MYLYVSEFWLYVFQVMSMRKIINSEFTILTPLLTPLFWVECVCSSAQVQPPVNVPAAGTHTATCMYVCSPLQMLPPVHVCAVWYGHILPRVSLEEACAQPKPSWVPGG